MAEITNGPRVYSLKAPVKILVKDASGKEDEHEIAVLNFKKPTGIDFRALDRSDGKIGMMFAFASSLTGQPDRVFDKLEAEDVAEVIKISTDFLQGFRATFESL
ncbi:hypothetical protein MMA231_00978 [Asticcacaulis sp. MM231]|uniref:hypothetical protein n=1 Tax=Asticcacaulis sp. MM231 TaxID=3157666 RepID=UPI0032D57B99